jgi:hypothetical protein
MSDYLAYILIGTGSSWGRSENKETAIEFAIRSLKDWNKFYEVSNKEVTVRVIDVDGYDSVNWEYDDVRGRKPEDTTFEKIDRPIERISRKTPNWKLRQRKYK